jgi:CRP-like cAMP-binding protein
MNQLNPGGFDLNAFLSQSGSRQTVIRAKGKHVFFSQGSSADCVFYLQSGRARLTVDARDGKVATVMLLVPGDFFGEESLAGADQIYLTSAAAITECTAIRLERDEMSDAMHREDALSAYFMNFLLTRIMRVRSDLVDQLFNSTEKRLARILLLMADRDRPDDSVVVLPKITQETLADLIGTTRSQVSLFMNRFRSQGVVAYKGRIRVHRSRLQSLLQD